MEFKFETIEEFTGKANNAIDWIVEHRKDPRSLLVLLDVILFLAFNPFQWPFANLILLFPELAQFKWYKPVFWSSLGVIFVSAVIIAARTKRPTITGPSLRLSAIKGLLPFGHDDSDIFSRLQRDRILKDCIQAITQENWYFGILFGESGAGKTSFLQAGLWPALEEKNLRCIYVKYSDFDPVEALEQAIRNRLILADDNVAKADFLGLLRAAVQKDSTPIVFLFDQFEQFFVHRKRKKDREPFVQTLSSWFHIAPTLPVKILISIRGDFLDRLSELQAQMRYALGPSQNFRLERFEHEQATEVFCAIAQTDHLSYDRNFIAEMAREELADHEDGLVSPVDIQVLAWMVAGQKAQDDRAFNRATFQKLGGVDGLLERYLYRVLETRETATRRQAAVKVLLALTDLERNTRAGALSLSDLCDNEKLKDIANGDVREAVEWLARSDVRLVAPVLQNDKRKFELAHERIIPAVRRIAGKQLGDSDRASLLVDRRVNEWLGNQRSRRYLFSWPELRLINKQRRFITWGAMRRAKEELIAASRKRLSWQMALTCLPLLLVICGWFGWNTNFWQIYQIKIELHNYAQNLNEYETLSAISQSFLFAGDHKRAFECITRINYESSKADALVAIAKSYVEVGDKARARETLLEASRMAERISDESSKTIFLQEIVSSYIEVAELTKDPTLLLEASRMAERISDARFKAPALVAIAKSYAEVGDKARARETLLEAIKTTEQISGDAYKAPALVAIAKSIAKLTESSNDQPLVDQSFAFVEKVDSDDQRVKILEAILTVRIAVSNVGRLRSLASHFKTEKGKAQSLARILTAYSRPELFGKKYGDNKDKGEVK
jgi:tetratricopeptide (TPR) repeat protein